MTPFVKNCKFITTTHDVLFLDFPKEFSTWYRLKRKLLFFHSIHKSEVRLTVSNYSRKKLMEHFGVNPDTVAVTPNAVKDIYFRPYDKQQIQKNLKQQYGIEDYILYVSRIERRKNHQLLLDAYAELDLAKSGKQLVLIGNNSLNDAKLTKQIEALKAQYPDKVHWFKYVSDADLLRFYQGADLFVYPSKGEGFGIPPIEAGALGINTLCANNTAMGDFDFFGNQLFDADNLEELKAKLLENEQSKKSPAQLKAISNAIRQYYSWEKSAAILNRAIRQSERSVVGIAEKRKRAA
jgi:glycosyltransferase involved in cell wall biosynthesis